MAAPFFVVEPVLDALGIQDSREAIGFITSVPFTGTDDDEVSVHSSEIARPSWLRRRKLASPACGFVLHRTKTLALRFFFNEAFRFDAQTHADWKHQSAPRVSVQNSWEPTRHFGLPAAGISPIFTETLSRFVFTRRTKRLRRSNFVCRRRMGRR